MKPGAPMSFRRIKQLASRKCGVGLIGVTCAVCGFTFISAESLEDALGIAKGRIVACCPECRTRTAGAAFAHGRRRR